MAGRPSKQESVAVRPAQLESDSREIAPVRPADPSTEVTVFDTDHMQLTSAAYRNYPIAVLRENGFVVGLEGQIYAETELDDRLRSLPDHLFPTPDIHFLVDWLKNTDGEFVVFVFDQRTNTLAVLNDILGRLPLYVYRDDQTVIISREIRRLLSDVDDITFDQMGMAQSLVFGFPLGNRTLWCDVKKVAPATLTYVTGSGQFNSRPVFEWDLSTQYRETGDLAHNATRLASLFSDACRTRSQSPGTNVVSLSGGHDSRAVAAGFHANEIPFTAVTFSRPGSENHADVRIAQQVCEALGVDWKRFDIEPPAGQKLSELLELKVGMNHLGMAYILQFFQAIIQEHGPNVVYFTGDGGDKALPDLRPPRSFDDVEAMVQYLLSKDSLVFSLNEVTELTGVSEGALIDEITDHVESYPESSLSDRYKHFKVFERGGNWLFEGEDRNRCFFWSTTPFYSLPFFMYAMSCPDDQKAGNTLYRAFVERLWPAASSFKDANYGVSMASPIYPLVQRAREWLANHPRLEDYVRTIYRNERGYTYDRSLAEVMAEQVATCAAIDNHLSRPQVERILADRSSCGRQQIYNLFTITATIDRLAGNDVLSEYPYQRFA